MLMLQLGVLVIVLPSTHTGGALVVKHGDILSNFDFSCDSLPLKPLLQWGAFHCDCELKAQEVTSGVRITLVYNLYSVPMTKEPMKVLIPLIKSSWATLWRKGRGALLLLNTLRELMPIHSVLSQSEDACAGSQCQWLSTLQNPERGAGDSGIPGRGWHFGLWLPARLRTQQQGDREGRHRDPAEGRGCLLVCRSAAAGAQSSSSAGVQEEGAVWVSFALVEILLAKKCLTFEQRYFHCIRFVGFFGPSCHEAADMWALSSVCHQTRPPLGVKYGGGADVMRHP